MEHYIIPQLETKRLYLRPVTMADASAIFSYASVKENIEYVTFPIHETLADTLKVIEDNFLPRSEHDQFTSMVIVLKETQAVIGMIDFTKYQREKAELGYILHRDYWGKGYMTEAAKVLVDYGFNHGIRKFICRHHPDNPGSQKVMRKLGFIQEGIQRQETYFENISIPGYVDVPIYSLLKEDFYE